MASPTSSQDQMFRVSGQFQCDAFIREPFRISHFLSDGTAEEAKNEKRDEVGAVRNGVMRNIHLKRHKTLKLN